MINFNKEGVKADELLERGSFGEIRIRTDQMGKWAVKIIKAHSFDELQQCFKEITLGFSCDNPYVLPVSGCLIEKDKSEWNVEIKLPQLSSSLRKVLNDRETVSEETIAKYFYEMVCGLQYLHGKGIAHRDIKPENILLDENGIIKIGGLGIGDFCDNITANEIINKAGVVTYAAPENRNDADFKRRGLIAADLWSLGMVMFELCTQMTQEELRKLVTSNLSSSKKLGRKLQKKLKNLKEKKKYSRLIDLISGLLRRKPMRRMKLGKIHDQLLDIYGKQLHQQRIPDQQRLEVSQNNSFEIHDQLVDIDGEQLQMNGSDREELGEKLQEPEVQIANAQQRIPDQQGPEVSQNNSLCEQKKRTNVTGNALLRQGVFVLVMIILMTLACRWINVSRSCFDKIQELEKRIEILQSIRTLENNLKDSFRLEIHSENRIWIFPKDVSEINDKHIKELAWQIGTHLKSIQYLSLVFSGCKNISDESVKELASHIGTDLQTLQHLSLSFYGCKQISDESVKELALQIGTRLETLQHLSLDFSWSSISDESFKDLALQIGTRLETLEHLSLSFSGCKNISDESVKELASHIGTDLQALQHLNLRFYESSISDESVKELALKIGIHLKTLQELRLNFQQTPVSQSFKEIMRSELQHIQYLSIV